MLAADGILQRSARLHSQSRTRCCVTTRGIIASTCNPASRHSQYRTGAGWLSQSYSGARTELTSDDGPTVKADSTYSAGSGLNVQEESNASSTSYNSLRNDSVQSALSADALSAGIASTVISDSARRNDSVQSSMSASTLSAPTASNNVSNSALRSETVENIAPNDVTLANGSGVAEENGDDVSADTKKPAGKYQLLKRVMVGAVLGLFGAVVILTGKKMYLCAVSFIVYLATTEYFGFLTSKGISKGMTPPPKPVSIATTVLCISITIATYLLKGQYHGTTLSVAAVALLACNLLALKKPTFSMLATSLFGLIYCGWLPSFWVRLRFVSTPLDNADTLLPGLVSGWVNWTLGLAVTFTAVACIAAADIGAYFVGKNLGKTQLTEISPKKTVEGAIGGMLSSVAVAIALGQLTGWPPSPWIAGIFGVLVFCSSLCGDLVESVMKREAEMKDSGSLFPGHGGLLDRFDSYMFTGAVVYVFSIIVLPRFA